MPLPRVFQHALLAGLGLLGLHVANHISLPGVNLRAYVRFLNEAQLGLLGYYNLLTDGGLSRASLVALGLAPYLTSRLAWFLASRGSRRLREWSLAHPERAERGRYALTVVIALVQSAGFVRFLERIPGAVEHPGWPFSLAVVASLTGGALLASLLTDWVGRLWQGEASRAALGTGQMRRLLRGGGFRLERVLRQRQRSDQDNAEVRDPVVAGRRSGL